MCACVCAVIVGDGDVVRDVLLVVALVVVFCMCVWWL